VLADRVEFGGRGADGEAAVDDDALADRDRFRCIRLFGCTNIKGKKVH